MSYVSMKALFESGAHFGHRSRFWNPKMAPYIYGVRGDIHIINLEKTVPMLEDAINFLSKIVANGGKVMFVGTKRSAGEAVKEAAEYCDMPYVNFRWLGGMMTNFKTIRQSLKRLEDIEKMEEDGTFEKLSKKEVIVLERERDKLARSLTGIRKMKRLPEVLFVIDVGHERIAIREAQKLGIPVVGIVDTNNSTEGVDFIVPGNDDSVRAIRLYVKAVAEAIRDARASLTTTQVGDDGEVLKPESEAALAGEGAQAGEASAEHSENTLEEASIKHLTTEAAQEEASEAESAEASDAQA